MRKTIVIALVTALVVSLVGVAITASADPQPSAKATAQIVDLHVLSKSQVLSDEDPDWQADLDWTMATNILSQDIHVASQKDLFIDVSLLSGLYTGTNVKSKGGDRDTSAATAAVLLRVQVDGVDAFPGWIVYNSRTQVLSAVQAGYLDAFEVLQYEEIGLFLHTLSANSFNFVVPDLDSGIRTVDVDALCVTFAAAQRGSATAKAVIGLGSVTIEEVRMIQDEDVFKCGLYVSSDENGEVDEPGEGYFSYDPGTVVDLVADPDPGYVFDEWTGDWWAVDDPDSATTTITMDDGYNIRATFEPD